MLCNNIIPSWTLEFEVRGIAHLYVKLVHNVMQGFCGHVKINCTCMALLQKIFDFQQIFFRLDKRIKLMQHRGM